MKKLSFLVSLTNNENDYQQEQAAAAEKAARRLGVDLQIVYADNDAVLQSQQLLHFIQGAAASRPDAIVFEPAGGTAFPQVARAAIAADIGWVVLNHDADYLKQLRHGCHVPAFSISSDHEEVGKIQVKTMRANWTEESAHRAVSSWLRLRTSQETFIDLVGAQDDSMAAGARKAFAEIAVGERERWLKIPFTGCDGLPATGQSWVRSGLLAATIYIRPNTDLALEMLTEAIRTGSQPPGRKLIPPESVPSIHELASRPARPSAGKHHHSAGA